MVNPLFVTSRPRGAAMPPNNAALAEDNSVSRKMLEVSPL
jgi:hypothetical protein